MKRLLLFVFFIPSLIWAQNDSKYLAGAVPVENDKVVFTKEINAPDLSSDQIYDIMHQWANDRFNGETNRVVYANKEKGDIAVVGEEYIVFQSTMFSLDRSLINYRLMIKVEGHTCKMRIISIRYEYNVSYKREPEKFIAEEWITDKYALNKSKTKLSRNNGKFRRKTIDLVDDIFQSATAALGILPTTSFVAEQPKQALPEPSVKPSTTVKEGYVAFAADKVPSTVLQLLPESKMQVAFGKNQSVKENSASWKGFGNMFDKSVASVSFDSDSQAYKTIGENDAYNISFFKEGETDNAWMIIECRKVGETSDGIKKTVMGEILNIWIK